MMCHVETFSLLIVPVVIFSPLALAFFYCFFPFAPLVAEWLTPALLWRPPPLMTVQWVVRRS
jgi:hypothetical protein